MEKDFDRWNEQKKELHWHKRVDFHEREIWWCAIGVNVGSEQYSKTSNFSRPVLIFRKWSESMFWGIPLTTKIKEGSETRFRFILNELVNEALILQMRAFDAKRLVRKITTLPALECMQLENQVYELLKTEPALESAGSSEAEATVDQVLGYEEFHEYSTTFLKTEFVSESPNSSEAEATVLPLDSTND